MEVVKYIAVYRMQVSCENEVFIAKTREIYNENPPSVEESKKVFKRLIQEYVISPGFNKDTGKLNNRLNLTLTRNVSRLPVEKDHEYGYANTWISNETACSLK